MTQCLLKSSRMDQFCVVSLIMKVNGKPLGRNIKLGLGGFRFRAALYLYLISVRESLMWVHHDVDFND